MQVKTTPCTVLAKLWEVVSADIFMIYNKSLLCIVDYYRKFLVIEKVGILPAGDLIQAAKVVFAEFGFPKNWFQIQAQILFQEFHNYAGTWV